MNLRPLRRKSKVYPQFFNRQYDQVPISNCRDDQSDLEAIFVKIWSRKSVFMEYTTGKKIEIIEQTWLKSILQKKKN